MTATTFTRLPLLAGSVVATHLGRVGRWTLARYMRAPLASTGLMAMVTLTAMAASNALYFQEHRHPAPLFGAGDAAVRSMAAPVADLAEQSVVPMQRSVVPSVDQVSNETTGSLSSAPAPLPEGPVGNKEAFSVQKKLTELGLFQGTVDGYYGPMTAQAIRKFEERNNMTPTGALTRNVIDAILRADAAGMVPVQRQAAVAAPRVVAQPVVQPAVVQPVPPAPVQAAPRVATQLPPLTPVDHAVDTVGNAAAQTLDSIVAAVDGGRSAPTTSAAPMPVMASATPRPPAQHVASLEPIAPPQPVAEAAPAAKVAVQAPVAPANDRELVSQIQRGLASLGFFRAPIDGHPGEATAKAIREFETFHSYQVTGAVNPDLVGLLRDSGATI